VKRRISGAGVTFLLAAVVLWILGHWLKYNELTTLGVAMGLCFVFALRLLLLRPGLTVQRAILPERVSEGHRADGVLIVTNTGGRPSPPVVAEEIFDDRRIGVLLPALKRDGRHEARYELPTRRRGRYKVGPLSIGFTDAFHLVEVATTLGEETFLVVHPRVHDVPPLPTGHSHEVDGPTSSSSPRGGIAFHSLRPYEPGDDPRLIHWSSTARVGELMVRHTVITNEPRLMVVLDTSDDPYSGDESFEDAVRVAASLVAAGAKHGLPTELRTTGGYAGGVESTGLGRDAALDALAVVKRAKQDPGLAGLMSIAQDRAVGVSVGIVTGRPAADKAAYLAAVRGRFQRVTLVQVGLGAGRSSTSTGGVRVVAATTSEDFARIWTRVRR